MRKTILAGLLSVGVLGVVGVPPAESADQATIDRAIARGVAFLRTLQRADGTWPHQEMGATALAGLALLECGAESQDKAVAAAARHVRQASIRCTHTYSLALGILFLDRLGDPSDEVLIDSMAVRLLAGGWDGGWGYLCPPLAEEEVRRLTAHVRDRNEQAGRGEQARLGVKRTVNDLPKEIQQQLAAIRPGPGIGIGGDNSNTQFGTIALWVARRHGVPVDDVLARVENRFRKWTNGDGGWGYQIRNPEMPLFPPGTPLPPGGPDGVPGFSSATMTCAGVLALAVAHGTAADLVRERNPRAKPRDIEKDKDLARALALLSTAVDHPVGDNPDATIPRAGGRSYYFLWSLERVCVALDLEALDKKDWYAWGTEILLANQGAGWQGEYAGSGADTCFALLFLARSNLTRDLTANLKGKLKDPAGAALKAGGFGGEGLKKGVVRLKPPIEPKTDTPEPERARPGADKEPGGVSPRPPKSSPSLRLADELVKAPRGEQDALLQKLQETKGVENTEALALAIPLLVGEVRQKGREALTARLARLKAESVVKYLEDEEVEIRRAAALACAVKKLKTAIPKLIPRLRDRDETVAQAAHLALKELTGQDLGSPGDWETWWEKQAKE